MKLTTTTFQPVHMTPGWVLDQLSHERRKSVRKRHGAKWSIAAQEQINKPFSIRQFIARAEKLK